MATARKSSLAADLLQDEMLPVAQPGKATPPPAFHENPPELQPAGEGIKQRAVAMTLYLLPEDHRRLRIMAATEGVSTQTLLMNAIDHLFVTVGQMPLKRWETRRRRR